jgi:hypothetical protein
VSFDASWLELREAADSESRARALERLVGERLRHADRAGDAPLEIVDLGSGTGSNLRHLAARLAPLAGGRQRWTLIDADRRLLDRLPDRLGTWAERHGLMLQHGPDGLRLIGDELDLQVEARTADLAADPLPVAGAHLVTASALLDLVARDWLARLAERVRAQGAAALFALSYDGRVAWQPSQPGDEEVVKLVNRHQRGDKGFGPALGPEAAAVAAHAFEAAGFTVEQAHSDWRLAPRDQALQQHLHAGWAAAASETAPHRSEALQDWLARRMDLLESGQGHVTVGHTDVLALP